MAQLKRINLNNSLPVFQLNLLSPLVEEPTVGQGEMAECIKACKPQE